MRAFDHIVKTALEWRQSKRPSPPSHKVWPSDYRRIRRLNEAGFELSEISQEAGFSEKTVARILREVGKK